MFCVNVKIVYSVVIGGVCGKCPLGPVGWENYFGSFCILVPSIIERAVLKSLVIIVDLSISLEVPLFFASCILKYCA